MGTDALGPLGYAATGLSYAVGRARNWGAPIYYAIETINLCNLRCVYCPQSMPLAHFPNGSGRMPLDVFREIVANLQRSFRVRSISLQRDGEPLMNKQIEEYVAHLTGLGLRARFSSNCALLDDDRAGRLIAAGLRQVKTDFCADADTYERLRVPGKWQRTLDGIRALLNAAEVQKSPLRLSITDLGTHGATPEAAHHALQRTRALFDAWPDRVAVRPVRFHNALGEAAADLSDRAASRGGRRRYTLCHQPWVGMTIDYTGKVVSCGRDLRSEHVLGDLRSQEARDVWNGEPMRRLRHALASRNPEATPLCGSCDVPWSGSYSGRSLFAKLANFAFSPLFGR